LCWDSIVFYKTVAFIVALMKFLEKEEEEEES